MEALSPMPVRETEAIILRSFPFKEADKIVSFFGRETGRMRGVAPNARRSVRRFGAGLALLSHVRIHFQEHPSRDLVRIESCDLLHSVLETESSYERIVAYSYLAEVCEQLLPEHEVHDAFFRLLLLVREEIFRGCSIWRPLTYFDLWSLKLAGLLPPLDVCEQCGQPLGQNDPGWFRQQSDGLQCRDCHSQGGSKLTPASRSIAREMLSGPLSNIPADGWDQSRASDLRRFLEQCLERLIERKLVTRQQLDHLP